MKDLRKEAKRKKIRELMRRLGGLHSAAWENRRKQLHPELYRRPYQTPLRIKPLTKISVFDRIKQWIRKLLGKAVKLND